MSARADRIAKLTGLIQRETEANHPNRAATFTALRDKFAEMQDHHYDYLMALNAAKLADPNLKTPDFFQAYYSKNGFFSSSTNQDA